MIAKNPSPTAKSKAGTAHVSVQKPTEERKLSMTTAQALELAVKYHLANNLGEAEQLYRQVLQAEPRNVDAMHLLGVIDFQAGRYELSVERIRAALQIMPNLAEAHCNLGASVQALGNLEEAVACFRRAAELKPGYPEAHNNLGNALRHQNKLPEAAASLQQALRLRPNYVGALTNLGIVLQKLGRLDEAVAHHEQALRYMPNHAEAYNYLGIARQEQGRLDEAIACYEQALRLKPDYAEAHNNLGSVLHDQGKLPEARACFERALQVLPNMRSARCNLGVVFQQQSDFAGAEQSFRAAARESPAHPDALWQLARLLRGKLPEADRAVLEGRLADPDLSDADRAKLLFGLAEVSDAKNDFDQAAALLRQANALMLGVRIQKGQGYNLEDNARFVENLIAALTPAFFERTRGFGLDTERPVFIVGLPRSGTTLTEQILAAHSQVFGAGELFLGREDFQSLGTQPTDLSIFTNLPVLPGDWFRRIAQQHLDRLAEMNRTAARVVDKMQDNYLYLGLLAALFPRAKFIHCRRDLRDVAVSCWMTHFNRLRWANDLEHIVTRFREYLRLMEHWRAVLPVQLLEVQYEETVADLPGVARRLVEWCGLDWEPACLAFHESKQPIRNASVVQVRQPIHAKSVARWRNYERDLHPLFAALSEL